MGRVRDRPFADAIRCPFKLQYQKAYPLLVNAGGIVWKSSPVFLTVVWLIKPAGAEICWIETNSASKKVGQPIVIMTKKWAKTKGLNIWPNRSFTIANISTSNSEVVYSEKFNICNCLVPEYPSMAVDPSVEIALGCRSNPITSTSFNCPWPSSFITARLCPKLL